MEPQTNERINSLDALRGFALLGILAMNIQYFSMPMAAYLNPTAYGDLTGANLATWAVLHLLTDQKMMAIFSMLFGAGIVLFTERATASGRSAKSFHYRRNFWLLLFGLAHGYLLWSGDVLFLYAVCAFVLFPFRNMSAKRLLISGIAVIAMSSLIYFATGSSMPSWPEEMRAELIGESWAPDAATVDAELAAFRGNWSEQMQHRVPVTAEMQSFVALVWGFWRAAGMMLLGMGLYKLGILSAKASSQTYARMFATGVLVGLPIVAYGIYWNFSNNWGPESMFLGSQFNYWGSVLVSLGWIGGIVLLLKNGRLQWLTSRLAAVGQMAFSNYILHTLICGFIFYGHGLGYFGSIERTGQLAIVLSIWALQLLVSPIWLRHFRFGPLEWLWRSLTYWQRQPFARTGTLANA